ncbi:MAG: DUF3841 domain-containing protein [Pirellulales bacterium]
MTDRSNRLVVWTIQPATVWVLLHSEGTLTVDPRYSGNLHHCYEWLRERLSQMIPGYAGHYPWWAYCSRPDLRSVRHNKPCGELNYLIELLVPRDSVILSPSWAWEVIYQGQFLSPTRREAKDWVCRGKKATADWEERWPLPEPWMSQLLASWERLFDPSLPNSGWLETSLTSYSGREAVFEVLELSQVRQVIAFHGSDPRMGIRRASS